MNYLVYKITNQINNKFYIGVHKTANIDDGYLGSGKRIRFSIEKYSKENFQKEILFNFNNPEEMYLKEKELVNDELLKDPLCYNIKLGGEGVWPVLIGNKNQMYGKKHSIKQKKLISNKVYNFLNSETKEQKEIRLKNISMGLKRYYKENESHWIGKQHSEDTKNKMSISRNKNKLIGNKNGSFNTCWIYSLQKKKSIKINKDELNDYINNGWLKGRKIYNE